MKIADYWSIGRQSAVLVYSIEKFIRQVTINSYSSSASGPRSD